MGQQQSKDELLYQQAVENNIDAVKSLCREGAGLEWMDKEGKTPLIVACMDPRLYILARTLIELGANVNAYRPGRHAGTPLHHAAKRGLDQIVRLLLSSGANPFARNDDCQTPLDVARIKGYNNVVRAIEAHICYFSGDVREILAPGFLKALAPQLLSRKSWAVIVPCSAPNPTRPPKLELSVYPSAQDAQPRCTISLWKSKIEEPKFHHSDPELIIYDQATSTRHKFASAIEGNKQELRRLYNACRGVAQVMPPIAGPSAPSIGTSAEPNSSAIISDWAEGSTTAGSSHNGLGPHSQPSHGISAASSSGGWISEPTSEEYNGWGPPLESNPASGQPSSATTQQSTSDMSQSSTDVSCPVSSSSSSVPSAPPLPVDETGHILYPTIDTTPVDLSMPVVNDASPSIKNEASGGQNAADDDSSSCVICWENPLQGACVPCGHMAGCMSCLNEIKAKKGGCPVCRAKIVQVIRIYAV